MRFFQLAVGERFILDQVIYRKSTPLVGVPEGGGPQRMIPRSTEVMLADGSVDESVGVTEKCQCEQVFALFPELVSDFSSRLTENGHITDASEKAAVLRQLDDALAEFRQRW